MLLIAFIAALAAVWFAFTLTAFCPLRAWRQQRELAEGEESWGFDAGQGAGRRGPVE